MEKVENGTELERLIQLTPFELTKENLITLASDYQNMIVTRSNLKEANEARLVLYRKRIEIQNVAKANRKTIKDFLKNNNDAIETELIETIEPTEIALEGKIKSVKDAIAEEERLEALRISKHKATLDNIKEQTVKAVNETDMHWLNGVETVFVLTDLEEFQAEGEQLLATLKETAKNRLELLEFQEAKRIKAEEWALAELKKEQEITEMLDASEVIIEEQISIEEPEPVVKKLPKMKPMETIVLLGAIPATDKFIESYPPDNDKFKLKTFAEEIVRVDYPLCESEEGKRHVEFVRAMLSKICEQTHKVAEKL
jgi:hypothetical protein